MLTQTLYDMTVHIEDLKTKRFKILLAVYKATDQDSSKWCDVQKLSAQEGIKNGDFAKNYHYLMDEGLLKPFGAGYTAHISHNGIKAIEFIISNPTQKSEYFPSYKDMGF